ncbi:MAG TPA: hypothetical protein VG406_24970 [Isosphaeraceae bacterium]|nr:hypothetical protein [Isosphaeraceae bacterium]
MSTGSGRGSAGSSGGRLVRGGATAPPGNVGATGRLGLGVATGPEGGSIAGGRGSVGAVKGGSSARTRVAQGIVSKAHARMVRVRRIGRGPSRGVGAEVSARGAIG